MGHRRRAHVGLPEEVGHPELRTCVRKAWHGKERSKGGGGSGGKSQQAGASPQNAAMLSIVLRGRLKVQWRAFGGRGKAMASRHWRIACTKQRLEDAALQERGQRVILTAAGR
jgi:hypothetical protein